MRSLIPVAVLCLLLPACGGGGGGGGPSVQIPGGPSDPQVIAQVLEQCALEQLAALEEVFDLLQQYLDSAATPPTPVITPINPLLGLVGFTVDIDSAGGPDLSGTFQIFNPNGTPMNLLPFVSGTPDLEAILASLPAGTSVVTTFAGTVPPSTTALSGQIDTELAAGGVPETVSGSLTSQEPGCSFTAAFDDVAVAALEADIPTVTYDVTIVTASETISGQIALDGTNTVVLTLAQQGKDPVVFHYDLVTQVLTLQP